MALKHWMKKIITKVTHRQFEDVPSPTDRNIGIIGSIVGLLAAGIPTIILLPGVIREQHKINKYHEEHPGNHKKDLEYQNYLNTIINKIADDVVKNLKLNKAIFPGPLHPSLYFKPAASPALIREKVRAHVKHFIVNRLHGREEKIANVPANKRLKIHHDNYPTIVNHITDYITNPIRPHDNYISTYRLEEQIGDAVRAIPPALFFPIRSAAEAPLPQQPSHEHVATLIASRNVNRSSFACGKF